MDRSFLSRPEVVRASRRFVCIRLTTYEDEKEAAFLRELFVGRSGEVENTTFTILTPDAGKPLIRTGRSTRGVFRSPGEMSEAMTRIASRYAEGGGASPLALPVTLNARVGLNVAAGDGQPLVVVLAKSGAEREKLEARLAKAAWSKEFLGRVVYASASQASELPALSGHREGEGYLFIEPDAFGQKGKVQAQLAATATEQQVVEGLRSLLAKHRASSQGMHAHRRAGITAGAFWEPKLPVTDPQEANARRRTRREIDQLKK